MEVSRFYTARMGSAPGRIGSANAETWTRHARVRAIEVGGYFDVIDGRVDRWWFGAASPEERARVPAFQEPRFHRTLGTWLNLVVAAGFVLERFGEPCADEAVAAQVPAVADTRVAPLFLHVRGRKLSPPR